MKLLNYWISLAIISGCSVSENAVQPEHTGPSLKIISQFLLDVPEPSGLAFDRSRSAMWTVSDQNGCLYKLDLTGNIIQTMTLEATDLEGVSFNWHTGELLVVEENAGDVVQLDSLGAILGKHQILQTHDNSGLEGVCADDKGRIFVIKEKAPGKWIALNPDFSIAETKELTFAPDYSDIACDTSDNRFWILSDQGQQLFLWDTNEGVLESYHVAIENPEGIVIDFVNQIFYIVSDSQQRLFLLTQ
ncbi:MAG: SdiA-regulated domain-containing protein [Candidatus Zhuqueibacterota bacterium]